MQGNLKDLANGKAANAQQGFLDANSASAHADKQLLASIQSKIYPETAQPEQAKGAGVTQASTTTAAASAVAPTSGVLAPSAPTSVAAPAAPIASARPGAGAGGRQGGGGRGGQRPQFPGAGAGGPGFGAGSGAGSNPVFPFPTRVPGGGNNNNKRSSFNGMRWARRFM